MAIALHNKDYSSALEYCNLAIQYSPEKNEELEEMKKQLEDYFAANPKRNK